MTKILIIEDEEAASKRLKKMVQELMPDAVIENVLSSVTDSVQWLQKNPEPELIFADIHLADGSSFEIFKLVQVNAHIIFTTAYDQYAVQAFRHNAIHYLLKPVKKEELKEAVIRFRKLQQLAASKPAVDFDKIMTALQKPVYEYKERFIIRFGEHIKTIETKDIAYFFTEHKANFAVLKDGERYPVDHNLDELETVLNPKNYFRINRQFVIGYQSIAEMITYSKARVLIKLNPPSKLETIVSTERSAPFKQWLAGE